MLWPPAVRAAWALAHPARGASGCALTLAGVGPLLLAALLGAGSGFGAGAGASVGALEVVGICAGGGSELAAIGSPDP